MEWDADLWIALVDFQKAFDTVEHDVLMKVLRDQGVSNGYVDVLQTLYAHQSANVCLTVESRSFSQGRGVKQGDPISALLFIAVLGACMDSLRKNGLPQTCAERNMDLASPLEATS